MPVPAASSVIQTFSRKAILMWLFSKSGHFSIGQHPSDASYLVVQAQSREELGKFVGVLDAVVGKRHEVQAVDDGDYRFLVTARRSVVAEAVGRVIATVDYSKFVHSFHVDFGAKTGYFLWMRPSGLNVAALP
jgi:hypothetical protein